jgi:hypothetical protein
MSLNMAFAVYLSSYQVSWPSLIAVRLTAGRFGYSEVWSSTVHNKFLCTMSPASTLSNMYLVLKPYVQAMVLHVILHLP